jgi:hypothetical protein
MAVSGPGPGELAETLETDLTDRETNMRLFAEHTLALFERALRKA